MTYRKPKKGFTLVEVLIVLVIMGIVAAAAAPGIVSYYSHAAERTCAGQIKQTVGDIRSALVAHRFASAAEVSIEIYRQVEPLSETEQNLPAAEDLTPQQLERLEKGTLSGEPLALRLSQEKSAVDSETYTIDWSFAEGGVSLAVDCFPHTENSLREFIPVSYFGKPKDLLLRPDEEETAEMYRACVCFLSQVEWSEEGERMNGSFTLDGEEYALSYAVGGGRITGNLTAAATVIGELYGAEIRRISEFRVYADGSPRRITLRLSGENELRSFDFDNTDPQMG